MKVSEFSRLNPAYAFDFSRQVREQTRIYDQYALDQFPVELEADSAYHAGSRGRPNLNQTLIHSQCATCHRVLRNDFFFTPPSLKRKNIIHSHCRDCSKERNANHYALRADTIRARRLVIWKYLAPHCAVCGFDKHMSAMDMHHFEQKEHQVAELITHVTFTIDARKVETLLREASKCLPVCANCHRMLHAGVITAPANITRPTYRIAELLTALATAT